MPLRCLRIGWNRQSWRPGLPSPPSVWGAAPRPNAELDARPAGKPSPALDGAGATRSLRHDTTLDTTLQLDTAPQARPWHRRLPFRLRNSPVDSTELDFLPPSSPPLFRFLYYRRDFPLCRRDHIFLLSQYLLYYSPNFDTPRQRFPSQADQQDIHLPPAVAACDIVTYLTVPYTWPSALLLLLLPPSL